MAQILPKNWGKNLIYHKNLMRTEYKKSIQRLRHLAEERHVQYRQEFIEYTRKKIEDNKIAVAEESRKINILAAKNNTKKTLLDFGFEKIQTQLKQAKIERQEKARQQNDRMKEIETKARREWIMEMNEKSHLWTRTPEELKFAQYRLLDKKILERIPRAGNYILDRSPDPQENVEAYEHSSDGYKGPLRTPTQKLAYLISKDKKLTVDEDLPALIDDEIDSIPDEVLASWNIDKNSQDYKDYLDYLKFEKENPLSLQSQELLSTKLRLERGISDLNENDLESYGIEKSIKEVQEKVEKEIIENLEENEEKKL